MANPSKEKGTRAETKVVRFLEKSGAKVRRRPLSGSEDKGDIEIDESDWKIVIEVKAGKMTSNPSRSQLEDWLVQAERESFNNLGHHNGEWYLIVVRYKRKLEDADVWYVDGDGDVVHMWLDDFRDYLSLRMLGDL